jgi:hypothetical protein
MAKIANTSFGECAPQLNHRIHKQKTMKSQSISGASPRMPLSCAADCANWLICRPRLGDRRQGWLLAREGYRMNYKKL